MLCSRHKEVAMQFEFKILSPDAIPRALAKAERYRLLNEPAEAESICRDALEVDPDNQEVIATLLLAITDQFDHDQTTVTHAWDVVSRLRDEYERLYYTGIIYERRAKALLRHETPRGGPRAYEWLREAMDRYERAEAIRPSNNDDALLRWNACARLIMADRHLVPAIEEPNEPLMLE
jgi:tetratricopeptide (TPR) repeat protein